MAGRGDRGELPTRGGAVSEVTSSQLRSGAGKARREMDEQRPAKVRARALRTAVENSKGQHSKLASKRRRRIVC
jgi:hypothetical protein